MDIYWDNKKHKSSTDKNDDKDKDKPDEPRDFIPPLEHTKLHMSNIGVDGNHIYFYSEVSRVRILELNRALIKVNNEMLKKKIELGVCPPLYLHIHSYGGSVLSCFATIDTILGLECPTVSIIEGAAASAATMISIVCDERKITAHSYMLIHQLSSGFWGKMNEIEDEYQNLKKFMNTIKKLYQNYTKVPTKKIDSILSHDLWFNAQQCLEYRLVDEIIKPHNKKRKSDMI